MSAHRQLETVFVDVAPWTRARIQAFSRRKGWKAELLPGPAEELPKATRREVQVLSLGLSHVTTQLLGECPKLRLVAVRATGVDGVDLVACEQRGITVCNVPHYGGPTVAELTFGLILSLTRHLPAAVEWMKTGGQPIESLLGHDLAGRTLGIIGTGAIGLHVARIGAALGMRVLAYDVAPQRQQAMDLGFTYADLDALLRRSDVVTVHVPLTPATHHLLSTDKLALMKPTAVLVNTARGGIVDSCALLAALNEGRLAGAALDVIEAEMAVTGDYPLCGEQGTAPVELRQAVAAYQLVRHPRTIVTPHIGSASHEAFQRILQVTFDNILAFAAGQPQNVITPAEG